MPARPHDAPSAALAVGWRWIGLAAGVLLALWLLDALALRTTHLHRYQGQPALTPLYVFWQPVLRPTAILALLVGTVFVALAPRLCAPARTRPAVFAASAGLLAAALAFAVFLVRDAPAQLGAQFDLYPDEEFWHDALRITHPDRFLAHHVELMPHLSTHGQHFPPGHALLLHLVIQVAGPDVLHAGLLVLALGSAAVPLLWLALREVASESAARQGSLLVAAAPSFLDFTCTAMDAVFLFCAALGLWAGLRAFGARGRPVHAALAGVALFLAACSSFSAFPLGLALAVHAVLARRAAAWGPLAITGTVFAACTALLGWSTGWWLPACLAEAQRLGHALMDAVRAGQPRADWARLSFGNAAAFGIGAGAGLAAAVAARLARDRWHGARFGGAAAATLVLMAAGPLYFLETERIWLFAIPWLAALALEGGPLTDAGLRRVLAASLAQAALMEALLFTLW